MLIALLSAAVAAPPIAFQTQKLMDTEQPTSLQFGPDHRLYVAQQSGTVRAHTVAHEDGRYVVTKTEVIDVLRGIPNHDDDGRLNRDLHDRLVTGILVTGTAQAPVIYATSSDPRVGDRGATPLQADTNSGIVSRITRGADGWVRQDLVRGLPRSAEDHAPHGLQLDGDTLYITVGGHTNMGTVSKSFSWLPETPLSGSILSIDLAAVGSETYDLPTPAGGTPFGGRGGKNAAQAQEGGPVRVHATGFRNAYDLLITEAGAMYTVDNGPNRNWGAPTDGCTGRAAGDGKTWPDNLHRVEPGTYAGHPNPSRGECTFLAPGVDDGALATFPTSTNGIAEYTASNFDGALRGSLLVASFSGAIWRLQPDGAGLAAIGDDGGVKQKLTDDFAVWPLDLTAQGDGDIFPGTIWVAAYLSNRIQVFQPVDATR